MFLYPNRPSLTNFQAIRRFGFDEWLVQPKWNGIRILPAWDGKKLICYTRKRIVLKKIPETLQEEITKLPHPILLDGELLPNNQVIFWDIAIFKTQCTHIPYARRLEILASLLPKTLLIETKRGEFWQRLWLRVRSNPYCEGLVFKQKDGLDFWSFGNSPKKILTQLKVKN